MGAVSCYIEHVITFEFVSEFAFVSAFAFVSCCIRFFHLPCTCSSAIAWRVRGTYPGWSGEQDIETSVSDKTAVLGKIYTFIKILVGQKRGGKRLLCLTVSCATAHIVVADYENHRLQVLTVEGAIVAAVGSKGSQPLQFHQPYDI